MSDDVYGWILQVQVSEDIWRPAPHFPITKNKTQKDRWVEDEHHRAVPLLRGEPIYEAT